VATDSTPDPLDETSKDEDGTGTPSPGPPKEEPRLPLPTMQMEDPLSTLELERPLSSTLELEGPSAAKPAVTSSEPELPLPTMELPPEAIPGPSAAQPDSPEPPTAMMGEPDPATIVGEVRRPEPTASLPRQILSFMGRGLHALEEGMERFGASVPWLAWPAVYGICLGIGAWGYRNHELVNALADHKVNYEQRLDIAYHAAGGTAVLALLYLLVITVDRLVGKTWRGVTRINDLNRMLRFLLILPIHVFFQKKGIEQDANWVLLLCALAGLSVANAVYHWPRLELDDPEGHLSGDSKLVPLLRRAAPWVAATAVLGLWAYYGYKLSEFAISNHQALHTRTTDLGYYDNIFYQSLHGRPLGCSFVKGGNHISAHFDPILVLLSPLYALYPRAEMLLVLQSVWLGAGVVPVYLMGRSFLGKRRYGLALGLIYVLYPALHGANLYEFHSLTLITPLVLWLLYFLEHRHFKSYAITLVLLLLCREDVPLLATFVGFYAIISGRRTFVRVGYLTVFFCVAYYLFVKTQVMPASGVLNTGSKEGYSYEYYFRDLIPHHKGIKGLLLTLISNPMEVLDFSIGDKQKIQYLLTLFVPLGLMPFFAKRARLMMLYGLLVALLASRKPVYKPHFQYACMIFPIAFAIAPMGLRRLLDDPRTERFGFDRHRLAGATMAFMVTAAFFVSWKYGVLWENTAFRGGFATVARPPLDERTLERYQKLREMVDLIPPGASVTTTNRLGPHVSNRREVYFYRQKEVTHYVLVDLSELGKRRQWHDDRVRSGELEEMKRYGSFVLYSVDPGRRDQSFKYWNERKNRKAVPKSRPRRPKAPLRPGGPKLEPTAPPAPSARAIPSATATPSPRPDVRVPR